MEVSAQSLRDVIGLSAGRAANTERRMEVGGMMDIKWRRATLGLSARSYRASCKPLHLDVGLSMLARYFEDAVLGGHI